MRRVLISLFVAMAMVSCSKSGEGVQPEGNGSVDGSATTTTANINIATKVEDATGVSFEDEDAIGIRIENTETGNVHTREENGHIKVVYDDGTTTDDKGAIIMGTPAWTFYTGSGYSVERRQISLEYITEDTSTTMCNVYAYSPFNAGVKDFEAVPFTLTTMYDHMWAKDEGYNLEQTDEKDVVLKFKHVLSRFRFKFTLKNPQASTDVTHLRITANNNDRPLVTSGTFNAKTGDITVKSKTSKNSPNIEFDIENANFNYDEEVIRDIYVCPMSVASEEDYTITFRFDSLGSGVENPTDDDYVIAGNIKIPAKSYDAGKSYTFNITFDNYAKIELDSVIEGEWEEKTEDFEI